MNGIHHNGKNSNFENRYAGCLGRMVNLFELNTGVSSANRLLEDKPHADGSSLSRSRSDVSRMSLSDSVEEKMTVSDYKSSFSNRKKSNGTPMKMLIDQEMSKEIDSRKNPPNLVAKLMGLDALPQLEPGPTIQSRHPRSHSEIPLSYWEQQNGYFHYVDPNDYKDADVILQQSQKPPPKETLDKKMAFVRQKFDEAKRLSMDEKLRQSKQFQDALEVLSSNKDLFLECLQEPDSFSSQHLYNRPSIPPGETRRITVLRPSKMADDNDNDNDISRAENKNGKEMKKGSLLQMNGSDKIHPRSSPEPTRIVVLKPTYAVNAVSSLPSELHSEDFFGDVDDDENRQSREVAKAITQQMREKLCRHRRDETLISSVFSNGYVGDESSFNKSEIDGNFSDSEVMSPVSRHSWDYVNRHDSPYPSSSFTRASYSPESSVCREAKKRLSERWAMMASNGSCQEQKPVRRSSSTLGEMLALSETKKDGEEIGSCSEEPKDLNSFLVSEMKGEGDVDYSPRNLTRSKSVPVSSTEIGNRMNVSVADKEKLECPKEDVKARSVKSSFKVKVSSLFFSKSKKPCKDKSFVSGIENEFYSCPGEDRTESGGDNSSSSNLIGEQGAISPKTGFAATKPIASGNPDENQDQPSPISVLDSPFEEDEHGVNPPLNSIGSNLIDKSPPIGSIARTLSWDDSCVNTASSHPTEKSLTRDETNENQEWSFLFKTLLSVAGLQEEMQSTSFLSRWHSPESPLDPSLRDKYIDSKDESKLHEANQRQMRSNQMLVFDCVNYALIEITEYNSNSGQRASTIGDEVWALMNAWFSKDVDDCGDDTCLMVERVVRKEVAGKGWNRHFRLEMNDLGKEIEGKLLEELLQEALVELTDSDKKEM